MDSTKEDDMKKLIIVVTVLAVAATVAMAAPRGKRDGRQGRPGSAGMIFRLASEFRAELNLTAEQNQKLDALLNDVKAKFEAQRNKMRPAEGEMGDAFVADDFNAKQIHADRQAKREAFREEMETYMTAKIQELHDLLTKEQRQKLMELVEEKVEQFKDRANDRRGGREGRRGF